MTKQLLHMFLRTNIRFLIDNLGCTGAALARKASVPKQFVTDLLAGRSPRSLANLKKVADALGVSGGIDELIFTDLRKKQTQRKSENLIETVFADDGENRIFKGRFEITLKRLKD